MVINNINAQYNGGLLSDIIYTADPRLLPSGNPFKYHVEALTLQPIYETVLYYIITTMFDVVPHCFCFVFDFCLVSLHGDYWSKCTV